MRLLAQRSRIAGCFLLLILVLGAMLAGPAQAQSRETVVVVGGGYGGIEAATRLAKDPSLKVILLDKAKHHTEVTRLHESAANNSKVQHSLADIARSNGFAFQPSEVTGIDLAAKSIQTRGKSIAYDKVIIAVGGATSWPKVPGLQQHALGLRTPYEATQIRNRVHERLTAAAQSSDPGQRKAMARIVVAGAGPTGVELAAEFAQAIPSMAKQYGLAPGDISVHLVQRGSEILSKVSDLKPKDRALAQRKLEKLGVVVHTNAGVSELSATTLSLKSGGKTIKLPAHTVVWAGGVQGSPVAARWGLPTGAQGRITVDSNMRIQGAKGAYAIGDSAAALHPKNNGLVAMTAQEAKIQAKVAAKNIGAEIRGHKLAVYKPKAAGTLVSIGSKDGVGRVLGIGVRGRLAHVLKRGIEFKHRRALRSSAPLKSKAKLKTSRQSAKSAFKARPVRAH